MDVAAEVVTISRIITNRPVDALVDADEAVVVVVEVDSILSSSHSLHIALPTEILPPFLLLETSHPPLSHPTRSPTVWWL